MDLKDFREKVKEYAKQYQEWKKPINEFPKKPREEYLRQNPDPTESIYSFLDQEYEAYFNGTQTECDSIRASFNINRDFEDLLLGYAGRVVLSLRRTGDARWLERGLVAVSLENSGRDYRDTYLSLQDLYDAAKDVGIDPNPFFQKAASLASQEKPRGGSTPLNVLLEGYTKEPEKPTKGQVREIKQVKQIKNDPISILKRLFKSDK